MFLVKGQIVNMFCLVACCCSMRGVVGNTEMKGHDRVPIKLYLERQAPAGFDQWAVVY